MRALCKGVRLPSLWGIVCRSSNASHGSLIKRNVKKGEGGEGAVKMGGRDRAFPLDSDAPVSGPGSSSSAAKRWWTHRNRGREGDQLADKEIQWLEAIFYSCTKTSERIRRWNPVVAMRRTLNRENEVRFVLNLIQKDLHTKTLAKLHINLI